MLYDRMAGSSCALGRRCSAPVIPVDCGWVLSNASTEGAQGTGTIEAYDEFGRAVY
ncbi:MAG: hypothetical protein ACRDT4_04995 [Micromonosporaceae bacterium]